MASIINYSVIVDTDVQELVNSVTVQCRAGWQPCGGIAITREPGHPGTPALMRFAQAMVLVGPPAPNGRPVEIIVPKKRVVG